jgi:RHS repeat-associated protein
MLILVTIGVSLTMGTTVAVAAAPINGTAPTISGSERLGQILTVDDGSWTGSADITYTYQWRRCDKAGDNCTNIAQAINGSYRLADADVSSTLRVVVTATNGAGATSAATTATDVVGTGETASEAPDTATRYDYDAAGRLKSVIGRDANAAPGDPLQAAVYNWDAVGNLLSVHRRATTTPQIDELHPGQGTVGRKVTITGTGFSKRISQDTVRFNGTEATILDASPTKLVVRVPSGATDGAVSVVAPGGTTTSPEPFTVTSSLAPHIDSISPSVTGIDRDADASETITISGSRFAERLTDNVVLVNGHRAELVSVIPGTLKIKAPPGTAGGRVVITTPEGTDTGPDLYIQPYGLGTGNVAQAQRLAMDEAGTIASDATDKVALALFDGNVGQEISIDAIAASGYAMVQVYSPNADKIAEFGIGDGWGNWMDTLHLPEDGTYTLIYQPTYYSSGGGHASVTVHDVGNAYAEAPPTAAGADVDLSSSVAGTNPGVRMNLEAGQEISVVGSGSTFGYANFRWIAPDGTELVASNGFGAGGAWWDSVRIPTSGRWTLRLDPQSTYTGTIHLKIYDASELEASVTPDADGEVTHATTTVPGQNVRFTFTGHAGQRISFMGTNDSTVGTSYGTATVTLLSPSGNHLQDIVDLRTTSTPTQLPADGTYSILVDPLVAQAGLIGLKVWDVPDDVDQDVTPSATGETKTIELPAAGQKAHLRIHATAGQKVSIKATDSTLEQASLKWYRPDGSFLGSYQYVGTGGAWFGGTKLDPAGTYDLQVGPENGSTGSIKLTFYDATDATPVSVTPTVAGAAFALNVAVPGQTATATFTGHAGQRIGMISVSTGFGRGYGYGALYAPDGSSAGAVGIGNESYTDRMTLTQNGTYTITAQGQFEDTGITQMIIHDVPADQSATVTPTSAGASTHFDIAPFQNATVHVDGHAGQKISVHVDHEATYLNAFWANPASSRFSPSAWFTPPSGFLDPVTLPADGDVDLGIDPWASTGGSTTVKLYDAPDLVHDLEDGGTAHLELATPGRNARVTFDGHAGDIVGIDFTNATIPHWGAALYGPSGSQIGYSWGASTTNTLPDDGQYTFIVDPWGEDTGSIDLTVTPSGGSAARVTPHTNKASHVKAGSPKGSFRTLKQYLRGTRVARSLHTGTAPARATLPKEAVAPKTLAEALGKRSMQEPAARRGAPQPPPGNKRQRSPLSTRMRRPSGTPEAWRPKRSDRERGSWVTGRQPSPWATVPVLQGRLGMTSVAGQALKLDGAPLKGVRVSVVGAKPVTTTDKTGRFLLEGVPAGKHTLRVEGSVASKSDRRYGDYELVVTLKANVTTKLDDTLWMTRLDADGDRKISSPTTAIRMTNPKIPGFEVRIPAGSRVTDRQGRTLHRLNLSAVPLDRPPFALPAGVTVSAYFTVQPGGAYFSKGAQIVYPNYHHLRPRSRVTFWDYDAKDRGWFEYGKGRVTANGKQIVPDKGVRVWKLSGAMAATNPGAPGTGHKTNAPTVGDPVDPYSGLFMYDKTDLSIGGSMPFNLTRTYRQGDPYVYEFGAGFTTVLDTRLVFSGTPDVKLKLVLTGGTAVDFLRTNSGTDPDTGIYEARGDDAWSGTVAKRVPERGLWLLTKPDGSAMEFNQGSPVTAFITKTGLRTTVTRGYRNIVNSLQQVNFPDGRWIRFDGNEIWDNAGRHVHYTLDYFQRLTQVKDADGNITKYEYSGNSDDLISITDPRGIKFLQNEYAGDVIHKQTLANGGTYTYNYICYQPPPPPNESGGGNSGGGGGGGGGVSGPMTNGPAPGTSGSEQERASTPCSPTEKYLATEITNPNGSVDRIEWNEDGGWTKHDNVGSSVAGLRRSVTQVLDNDGRVAEMRSNDGRSVKYTYNSLGEVETETTAIDADHSATVHYGYGGHDLTSITDALGKVTQLQRDAKHRVTSATDSTQRTTLFTYSGVNPRPITVTDPGGKVTRLAYEHGDLASVTDPLGHTTTEFADAAGRGSRVTDALGRTTALEYSPAGKPTRVVDPRGRATTLEYDGNGSVTKLTDARGNAISATYDDMQELATYTDANDGSASFERDIDGNVTTAIDRRGNRSESRFDALGRRTFVGFGTHEGSGGAPAYTSTQQFEYDAGSRVTTVEDSESGTTELAYDARDLPLAVTDAGTTITYEYDAAGRTTSMKVGDGTPTTYAYDDAGRLTGVAHGGVGAAFTLDTAGRRVGVALPGGINQSDTLDDAGRILSRQFSIAPGTAETVNYAYNAANHRIASWGSLDASLLPDAVAAGTFDPANRMTSRGTTALSHDTDGNLTSDGQRQLTWDTRGRLSTVTQAGATTEYGYDALGRRATTSSQGLTTRVTYDGWNAVKETPSAGAAKDILAGLDLDEVFASTVAGQTTSLLKDANQTTIGHGDNTGVTDSDSGYDPFGKHMAGTVSAGDTWAGGTRDDTGLVDRRNRMYDPKLKSFISEDPLGVAGGTNLYAYTGGNPIDFVDPTGLLLLDPNLLPHGAVSALWNADKGVANGMSFGYVGHRTGLEGCGMAGQVGSWIGGSALAAGVTYFGGALLIAGRVSAGAATVASNTIGGTLGSISSSLGNGQKPSLLGIAAGAFIGFVPGGAHVYGAGRGAGSLVDIWRVGPAMPTGLGIVDAAQSLSTGGGGRKC